jgi:hypothetical protein
MSKSLAVKQDFVQRRAEGQSYTVIAAALHISKSTCSAWESALQGEIVQRRQEELNTLYQQYGMLKTSRIKRLGQTLDRIDAALESVDLTQLDPAKLLDYKLKYSAALKSEFTGAIEALPPERIAGTPSETYYTIAAIYERLRNGEIDTAQAKLELEAVEKMRAAYKKATEKPAFDLGLVDYSELDEKQTLEALLAAATDGAAYEDDIEEPEDE